MLGQAAEMLKVRLAALAGGCALELQRLSSALHGPGFFACTSPDLEPSSSLVTHAYAASRALHERSDAHRWVKTKCSPHGQPRRWWLNAQVGQQWPEDEASHAAVRAMDAQLALAAATLALATVRLLGLTPSSLGATAERTYASNMRVLRYAPGSVELRDDGIPSHVDFGDFTLCHSNAPGLQVWDRMTGEWHEVPGGELMFLASVGLQKKSKGVVRAVHHRVQAGTCERYSFCRFHGVKPIHRTFEGSVF
eukprot:TRINITY_DN64104_c0_g1_i1.p1 TRINITY_DN64104_c0_g1~~TRINITY_DN64104_c0_g1_i1.p1  ORF type:complete len:251 (+),score=36.20 TRINITY_DN64104_c0_g1_i1:16-768(+)